MVVTDATTDTISAAEAVELTTGDTSADIAAALATKLMRTRRSLHGCEQRRWYTHYQ